MCWYSNYRIETRQAVEGEELVIKNFPKQNANWPVGSDGRAVCIADGCKLKLSEIPGAVQSVWGIGSEAIGQFCQTSEWFQLDPIHDIVLFESGRSIMLKLMPVGVKIDVLSNAIAAVPVAEPEPELEAVPVQRRL